MQIVETCGKWTRVWVFRQLMGFIPQRLASVICVQVSRLISVVVFSDLCAGLFSAHCGNIFSDHSRNLFFRLCGNLLMMIMMMTTFKGAVRDFSSLLIAQRTTSNTYAQVAKAQSCANHVQHIERLSRATCRVQLVQRNSSATKFDSCMKSHLF